MTSSASNKSECEWTKKKNHLSLDVDSMLDAKQATAGASISSSTTPAPVESLDSRKTMSSSSLLDLAMANNQFCTQDATTKRESEIGQQVPASDYMVRAMVRNSPTWVVSDEDKNDIIRHLEQEFMEDFKRQYTREQATDYKRTATFGFLDVAPLIKNSINCIIKDSFTRCFQSHPARRWNWNAYLLLPYLLGIVFRYLVLFPLRFIILIVGTILFFIIQMIGEHIYRHNPRKIRQHRQRCSRIAGYAFRMSVHAVVRVHGQMPKRRPNQVFVSNHTSLLDVVVMYQLGSFAVVGQSHQGFIGFLEQCVLSGMECVWFDRSQAKDRQMVATRIGEHVRNIEKPPLLIFPEGTCVNNKYIVMFKRGAFELPNVEIVPVAIKYNKIFVDAFWNSRQESFATHFLRVMTSWALVCDVYLLDPQHCEPGESSGRFAERVKRMIAKKAKLALVPWDGYLKHYQPKPIFLQDRQRIIAESLRVRFKLPLIVDDPEVDVGGGQQSEVNRESSSVSLLSSEGTTTHNTSIENEEEEEEVEGERIIDENE